MTTWLSDEAPRPAAADLKRSIPTRYAGILFRSKLEADWARAFDALGVKWRYEPEGRYFGEQFYLVDFYLPMSRQWLEVKGVFEPDDVRKIASFLEHIEPRKHTGELVPDIALIACMPDGHFVGWERGAVRSGMSLLELSRLGSKNVILFSCGLCRGFWFADDNLGWTCQCCGRGDGARHLSSRIASPLPGFPDLSGIRPLGDRA